MVFANSKVRALLPVSSQVAIGQVVPGQTLVLRYSGAFENRQGAMWKSTHVNLVGAKPVAALTDCCKRTRREGAANPSCLVVH